MALCALTNFDLLQNHWISFQKQLSPSTGHMEKLGMDIHVRNLQYGCETLSALTNIVLFQI